MDSRNKRNETTKQARRLLDLLRTEAPDSMIRDQIRTFCKVWKIRNMEYEFKSLPSANLTRQEIAETEAFCIAREEE